MNVAWRAWPGSSNSSKFVWTEALYISYITLTQVFNIYSVCVGRIWNARPAHLRNIFCQNTDRAASSLPFTSSPGKPLLMSVKHWPGFGPRPHRSGNPRRVNYVVSVLTAWGLVSGGKGQTTTIIRRQRAARYESEAQSLWKILWNIE